MSIVSEIRTGGVRVNENGGGGGEPVPVTWDDFETPIPDVLLPETVLGYNQAITDLATAIADANALITGKADANHNHDIRYYLRTDVDNLLSQKAALNHNHDSVYSLLGHNHDALYAPLIHNHDSVYYTESEVNSFLQNKADLVAGKVPASQLPASGNTVVREELVAQWDQSITRTNIPATFGDLYTQANADGKSVQIDTTGKTQLRFEVLWNKIGTGVQTVRVIESGTTNVLCTLDVVSGLNSLALTAIPVFAINSVKRYRLQAKSTVATDDPIFEGARIYLK